MFTTTIIIYSTIENDENKELNAKKNERTLCFVILRSHVVVILNFQLFCVQILCFENRLETTIL